MRFIYTTLRHMLQGLDIMLHNVHCCLFLISRKWKKPKCLTTIEYIHTLEYWSAVKENAIMMNLKLLYKAR